MVAVLALFFSACGGEPPGEPSWTVLARGLAAPPAGAVAPSWEEGRVNARPDAEGRGLWVDHALARADWQERRRRSGEREWWTPRPHSAGFRGHGGERVELRAGARAFRELEWLKRNDFAVDVGQGLFVLDGEQLVLRLPESEEPPLEMTFTSWVERGFLRAGLWRATARDIVADGLSLWPGERTELESAIPPHSALRLTTVARGLSGAGRVCFRVLLDGEVLLEHDQSAGLDSRPEHHVLALPRRGRSAARWTFAVDGDPAVALFANPVLGPARPGTRASRPWEEARPDVVLFVADTFRADCMAAYGGDPRLTPNLNALAERSVRFLQARSPSVWTLPSHASLFTGVLPSQHGALMNRVTFAPELVTLAELFAAHGYRTGAVTESGFVSRHFAMDQGFEWFEEWELEGRRLSATLSAALEFLDRDDGRPVFLFVHTYRTHDPYRRGREESREALDAFMERVKARLHSWDRQGELVDVLTEFAGELHELYLDGARALDEELGPFFSELEARGLFERGYLVFTSDHGEAFFEHGDRGHRDVPHEEKIRVPLLLHGAGLAPRDVRVGAGLIDVAPTLADLCALPRSPLWVGESLIGLDRERPLFSYNQDETTSFLAVVEGGRKILLRCPVSELTPARLERGELEAAFSLAEDPGELANLLEREAWPRELSRSVAPLWDSFARPLAAPPEVEHNEELAEDLRALGYAK